MILRAVVFSERKTLTGFLRARIPPFRRKREGTWQRSSRFNAWAAFQLGPPAHPAARLASIPGLSRIERRSGLGLVVFAGFARGFPLVKLREVSPARAVFVVTYVAAAAGFFRRHPTVEGV